MLKLFKSESLKYKRTFTKGLMLGAPFFFVLYAFLSLQQLTSENNYFIYTVFNWWPLIFVPLGISLVCILYTKKEKKTGQYRLLRCYDIDLKRVWYSKVVAIAYFMLISNIILLSILLAIKIIIPSSISSIVPVIVAVIIIWITSLVLIPINLWMADRLGIVGTFTISFIGSIAGVIVATESIWFTVPWSWGLRLMCPIIGVHPNGVPLEASDILCNAAVIPVGILISIISFAIFTILTGILYAKREVA